MHALVLMYPSTAHPPTPAQQEAHVGFIDELDKTNTVVLGGAFKPPVAGIESAYLVSCETLDDARAIAASDPLVPADVIRVEVIEWELVGVNPDSIDRGSLLYPD